MHRRARTLPLLLLLSAVLTGSGCGSADSWPVVAPDPLDAQLQVVLPAHDVTPVTKPAAEPAALVELGRMLFFDKVLSGHLNISCATCHHPVAATGDALPVSLGEGGVGTGAARTLGTGRLIPRNAPHLFNAGVPEIPSMFWDSRVTFDPVSGLSTPEAGLNGPTPVLASLAAPLDSVLAAQAMFPVTSHDEMLGLPGSNQLASQADHPALWAGLMARLGGHPTYRSMFAAAFPAVPSFADFTFGHAARAIAAYEREAFTALDSPFDRYLAGETTALSDSQKRGALLFFGRAECGECHGGPLLSDFEHYALCVPQIGPGKDGPFEDTGLALETGLPEDRYKFRTPPLRNVALTGPWMHDGAFTTLDAAVRHHLDPLSGLTSYDVTQLPDLFRPTHDTDPTRNAARADALDAALLSPPTLTPAEFVDLIGFLDALTDPASLDLLDEIPATVPSGLPVAD